MNLKYMKISLFEISLQEKMNFFHNILIYWDAPVYQIKTNFISLSPPFILTNFYK